MDHKKVMLAADSETSACDQLLTRKTFNPPLAASQIISWPRAQKVWPGSPLRDYKLIRGKDIKGGQTIQFPHPHQTPRSRLRNKKSKGKTKQARKKGTWPQVDTDGTWVQKGAKLGLQPQSGC